MIRRCVDRLALSGNLVLKKQNSFNANRNLLASGAKIRVIAIQLCSTNHCTYILLKTMQFDSAELKW